MDLIVTRVDAVVEQTVSRERAEQSEHLVTELGALELALVGGGVANVAF